MYFAKHSDLEGKHALLSPSSSAWVNYDENKLDSYYVSYKAKERGTDLHALACECIRLGVKLPRSKKTLNMYVNDAIGYRMTPEQTLYYSDNCFGTADTIAYRDNFLRIHDLKTGIMKAGMRQLEVYAALFFLEYNIPISHTNIELRIYQSDNIVVEEPEKEAIIAIMNKIVAFDKRIRLLKGEN